MKQLSGILLLTFFLTGCQTYEPAVRTSFTKTADIQCPHRAENISLFYKDNPPQSGFTKIGDIEAFGNDTVDSERLVHYLQYRAWQTCADGVMGITVNSQTRGEQPVTVMSGTAIKLHEPDIYNSVDTSFIATVRKDSQERQELQVAEDKKAMTVTAFALAIIFAAIVLL